MKLFFDLDGTLIDAKPRLYKLFCDLVESEQLSFDQYWDLKRSKIGHETILKTHFSYSKKNIDDFNSTWLSLIETNQYLKLDSPFSGVQEFLKKLAEQHSIYIVTARQFEFSANLQIQQFGWDKIISGLFVTSQKEEKSVVIHAKTSCNSTDWMIGDTGKDIQAGKILGMKTAAVLSGFQNKLVLEKYEPTIIVESILNLTF
jgi:phosphoglycolate phosphatase